MTSPPMGSARAAAARLGALVARLGLHVGGGMGARPGERRFPGRPQPSGLEVEAHSAYAPGDDLRHLDWNLFGRLDMLLMRRFTAEREVVVHLLLDASASMGMPADDRKWQVASELALALAAIAIASRHAARLVVLPGEGAPAAQPPGKRLPFRRRPPRASAVHRRRAGVVAMADLLDATAPRDALDLGAALADYAHRHAEGGAALVVSDFLCEPERLEPGVAALRRRGHAVYLLQVLGRGEMEPARAAGNEELVDAESGETHALALTAEVLARYAELLVAHQDALRALALRQRATWVSCVSDTPVEQIVLRDLVRVGLVRAR
jgi:uncharacterized protein (DUF58 family)